MSPSTSRSKAIIDRKKTSSIQRSPIGTPKSMFHRSIQNTCPSTQTGAIKSIGESLVCEPGTPTKERGEPKEISLTFHLYSPKTNKPTPVQSTSEVELTETPDLRYFTLPITAQTLDISDSSLEALKTKLFYLVDEIDPDQIGNRNSTALKAADELGLVSIRAYILDHPMYDWEHHHHLESDVDVASFFEAIRTSVVHEAGAVVTMKDPMFRSDNILVPETGAVVSNEDPTVSLDEVQVPESSSGCKWEYTDEEEEPVTTPCKKEVQYVQHKSDSPTLDNINVVEDVTMTYLSFQGISITVDHTTVDALRSKNKLIDYLNYISISTEDIQQVLDILRPHRINSFEKFLYPAILNVDHLVKWGIHFGTAMDMIFKAREYYQELVKDTINPLPDHGKGGYVKFQGHSIKIDRHTLKFLIRRTKMIDYLVYASIQPAEIQEVKEILRTHCIESFDKFLFPAVLNVDTMVKWGIRFGTAMDIMFKSRDFYQHIFDKELLVADLDALIPPKPRHLFKSLIGNGPFK